MRSLLTWILFLIGLGAYGQTTPVATGFDKRFRWGFTYTQGWSTIEGSSLEADYYTKPSIGAGFSAEYFPKSFIGIGLGVAYQQRGAGVRASQTSGLPDTANNIRLRFNTVEVPVSITLRTPMDIVRGVRLSGSLAYMPVFNLSSKEVFNVLVPSIRDENVVQDVSSSYFKSDAAYQFSIGPEFLSGTGIFRVHFFSSKGSTNVYKTGAGTGQNHLSGIKLTVIF